MTSRNSDDSVQNRQKSRAWGALLLAGGFEVGYALSVNGSQGFTNLAWSLIALVFFLAQGDGHGRILSRRLKGGKTEGAVLSTRDRRHHRDHH